VQQGVKERPVILGIEETEKADAVVMMMAAMRPAAGASAVLRARKYATEACWWKG
jgi:hypothetical protein